MRRVFGRSLREGFEHEFDRPVELGISVRGPVLWGDDHLFVWGDTVIFDFPSRVVEPERVLGLRRDRPVGEPQLRRDPNYPAPRASADDRSQAERLERLGEDVSVRARPLIGDRHHRSGNRRLRDIPPGRAISRCPRRYAESRSSRGEARRRALLRCAGHRRRARRARLRRGGH